MYQNKIDEPKNFAANNECLAGLFPEFEVDDGVLGRFGEEHPTSDYPKNIFQGMEFVLRASMAT